MSSRKIKAPRLSIEIERGKLRTSEPLASLESKARFSLAKCKVGGNYCLSNVARNRALLSDMYKAFGKFENLTWHAIQGMTRESGISIEKKSDPTYTLLSRELPESTAFGHFRVSSKAKGTFRVFGGRIEDLFYVIYFDVEGEMHH